MDQSGTIAAIMARLDFFERRVMALERRGEATPVDAYSDLALTWPPPTAATTPFLAPKAAVPPLARPPVAHEVGPDDDEADFEPQEVDFNQAQRWAAQRHVEFRSWDDLPKINARREAFELPPFKRKMPALATRT
jgi:hypothetical protein